jgi:hypothetical protein
MAGQAMNKPAELPTSIRLPADLRAALLAELAREQERRGGDTIPRLTLNFLIISILREWIEARNDKAPFP